MSELPVGIQRREFEDTRQLATRGEQVADEPINDGWRLWDPYRSKLAATLEKGLDTGLMGDTVVLYLGAANGTTVSHVADVAGPTYAIEFASRPARDLVEVATDRPNLFPLLKDARQPETYGHVVESDCDVIVQDVATRGQARVSRLNRRYLADDGRLVVVIKARSENVARNPDDVFEDATSLLERDFNIINSKGLAPFHDDHLAIVATPH